ncbi:MAG TPA: hypothetical protein PK867_02510 [Pirellulales bacterium]|nr:hypothetical protein [Pirellulales bacterium]
MWFRSRVNSANTPSHTLSFRRGKRRRDRSPRRLDASLHDRRRHGVERLECRALLSAGQLDPTFGQAGVVSTNIGGPADSQAKALVVTQTDGKVVVVGQDPDNYAGGFRADVVRYNTDGSLDATFGNNGEVVFAFSKSTYYNEPAGVAMDASGHIIVAGNVYGTEISVARLNSNGSFDASFGNGGIALDQLGAAAAAFDQATSVAVDSSGRILVAGNASDTPRYGQQFAVARLNADGSVDSSFGGDGAATVSYGTGLDEYDSPSSVALDSAGHIVLAGTAANGTGSSFAVARFNSDGTLDTTFNNTGKAVLQQFGDSSGEWQDDYGSSLAIDASDDIVVAGTAEGSFSDGYGQRFAVARLTASGALDSGFGTNGKAIVTFTSGVPEYDWAAGVALDSSGHIVVAGTVNGSAYADEIRFAVARLNSDGSLDTSFAGAGKTTISFAGGYNYYNAAGVALDSNGHIVLAGTLSSEYGFSSNAIGVVRLNTGGSLDGTWGSGGLVTTSVVDLSGDSASNMTITQPDGKIVVVGTSAAPIGPTRLAVTRYNPDGTLDSTFGQGGKAVFDYSSGVFLSGASTVALDSQGRILIAGDTFAGHGSHFAVVRLNADGSPDTTFASGGEAVLPQFGNTDFGNFENDFPAGLAIDSSGRIVLAGTAYSSYDSSEIAVARLNADGSLDTSFANSGEETISGFTNSSYESDTASGVVIDSSERIVVAGTSHSGNVSQIAVTRLNSDGSFDASFAGAGKTLIGLPSGTYYESAAGVALDSAGRIVVGGAVGSYYASEDFLAVRLNAADGSLDQSFGNGGEATINSFAAFGYDTYVSHIGSMAIDGAGRIALVGEAGNYPYSGPNIAVAMFDANGCPDVDFGVDGTVETSLGTNTSVVTSGAAFDSAGRLVVTGTGYGVGSPAPSFTLVRYLAPDQVVEAGSSTFASDLQAVVTALGTTPPPGTPRFVIHVANQTQMTAVVSTVANLSVAPNEPEIEVLLDIDPGTYSMGQISVPAGLKLIIDGDNGACGTPTLSGTSAAALTIASGDVLIRGGMAFNTNGQSDLVVTGGTVNVQNGSFTETGSAPAVLVTGGQLTMRGSSVTENTSTGQAAFDITAGQVDLGTTNTDPSPNFGNNTISVNGAGMLIHLVGPNDVMAVGDNFLLNGSYLGNYQIEDLIDHSLDGFGPGTVYWVPDNVFVSTRDGVIQTGVNVIPSGGEVNVQTGVNGPFYVGSKLLTIAYESAQLVTQQADTLNPSQVELVYQTYSSNNSVKFVAGTNPGEVQVNVDNLPKGTFLPTGRLIAHAGYGDNISVDSTLTLPAWLFGNGGGRIKGGGGNNVLIDDGGNELLMGGSARDLIIGNGGDRLASNGGQDLMIAGYYSYEFDETALAAIMAEWTSAYSLAARLADLTGDTSSPYFSASRLNGNYFLLDGGANQTVFQDFSSDTLTAGSGPDLVFASAGDTIHGLTAADLDFIING